MAADIETRIGIARLYIRACRENGSSHISALQDAEENLADAKKLLSEGEREAAFDKLVLAEEQLLAAAERADNVPAHT